MELYLTSQYILMSGCLVKHRDNFTCIIQKHTV